MAQRIRYDLRHIVECFGITEVEFAGLALVSEPTQFGLLGKGVSALSDLVSGSGSGLLERIPANFGHIPHVAFFRTKSITHTYRGTNQKPTHF